MLVPLSNGFLEQLQPQNGLVTRSLLFGSTSALQAYHCYREKIRNRGCGFSVHCENAARGTAQFLREAIIDGVSKLGRFAKVIEGLFMPA